MEKIVLIFLNRNVSEQQALSTQTMVVQFFTLLIAQAYNNILSEKIELLPTELMCQHNSSLIFKSDVLITFQKNHYGANND